VVHDSLVYRPSSSTEAVIQRTFEGIQRMISISNTGQAPKKEEEGDDSTTKIKPATKKHWESQIRFFEILQRDAEKTPTLRAFTEEEIAKVVNKLG
jgi:hypothetical protein